MFSKGSKHLSIKWIPSLGLSFRIKFYLVYGLFFCVLHTNSNTWKFWDDRLGWYMHYNFSTHMIQQKPVNFPLQSLACGCVVLFIFFFYENYLPKRYDYWVHWNQVTKCSFHGHWNRINLCGYTKLYEFVHLKCVFSICRSPFVTPIDLLRELTN